MDFHRVTRLLFQGFIINLALLLPLWGCSKAEVLVTCQIIVITSLGGVGDHVYNDLILAGIERAYAKLPDNTVMMIYNPSAEYLIFEHPQLPRLPDAVKAYSL